MYSLDYEILRQAQEWLDAGHRVHLTTVIRTWGSAPRQPGSMAALRDDGLLVGSVSGGCIEDDLIQRATHAELPAPAGWLSYGLRQEDIIQYGLPCGGSLKLFCEDLTGSSWLPEVLEAMRQHRSITREVDTGTGLCRLSPAQPDDQPGEYSHVFRAIHGPQWRLLIIGANQTSKALADIAGMLGFHVLVCDPRKDFLQTWHVQGATTLAMMPDDAVVEIGTDERTAIVAVTHDPKLDDMALLEALKSRAFYVGALGSKRNSDKRRERLALFELSPGEIERLRGPVGLSISSRTPAEIAVAIAAELIQVRNNLPQMACPSASPVSHSLLESGASSPQ